MRKILAGRFDTVVATHAVAGDIEMVEIGGQPPNRRMAVVAICAAADVSCMFACRRHAVMAGTARTQNLRVIDRDDGNERNRTVTVFADVACLHVCRVFAGRGSAVMATYAIIKKAGVVEIRGEPACRIVTIFAPIPGRDVCWGLSGCLEAIVTTDAVSAQGRMVDKIDDGPVRRNVAIRAFPLRRNMAGRLR